MNKASTLFACCLLLCAGCATQPFEPVAMVPLEYHDAKNVYDAVRSSLPTQFAALTSVVFAYRGRSMLVLGYTEVDATAGTFSVVAMTPLGMKLFELHGDKAGVESFFVVPELSRKVNPIDTIAEDIRNMYLDLLPDQATVYEEREDAVVFKNCVKDGRLAYVLGGDPPVLVEKRLCDKDGTIWCVTYHEYIERDGKLYPKGIILRHHRYGYRLIIRLKEILDQAGRSKSGTETER